MADNNPYSTPSADVVPEFAGLQSYEGFRRLKYFLLSFSVFALFGIVMAILVPALGDFGASDTMLTIFVIGYIVVLIITFWIAGQRFRNIGRSPWNSLWFLVPLVNFYFGWMAIATPEGYADHKKLDTAGVVITVLYVLMVVGSIVLEFAGTESGTLSGPVRVR